MMRNKIEELNNEIFRYTIPDIVLSDEKIEAFIKPNRAYMSSIEILTSDLTEIEGIVYSDNDMLSIKNDTFKGIKNEIQYEILVDNTVKDEFIEGNIKIVTNCGEVKLPYSFIIIVEGFDTSLGLVKDLFQFTDLAMESPEEALKVFCSKSFKKVFLKNDKHELTYESLIKSGTAKAAMEEFLIEINKKKRVKLILEEKDHSYYVGKEPVRDEIILTKSTWGYCRYKVYADRDFVKFDTEYITSSDFTDGKYKLMYTITDVEKIRKTVELHIYIENINSKYVIDIKCTNKEKDLLFEREDDNKVYNTCFMKNYINYKIGIIDLDRYIADNELIVKNLDEIGKSYINELYKIHLCIESVDYEKAMKLIKTLETRFDIDYTAKPIYRCFCMYFKCLINNNKKEWRSTCEAVASYYDNECHTWPFLRILFKLDDRYKNNPKSKLEDMKEMSAKGCISPVMYYEACTIFKEDISYMSKIGMFEVQVINWAIKNFFMSEELASAYAISACRIKEVNVLIYRTLVKLYDMYEQKEVLTAICVTIIKGQLYEKKYFKWYEKAVALSLRVTGLYEGYLYSCDENRKEMFPDVVFSYFLYNNNISDKKKIILYDNLISYKAHIKNMYNAYIELMEKFVLKQLDLSVINKKMKNIYEEILPRFDIEEIAEKLTNIIFLQEVECFNSKYMGVLVLHKVVEEEQYVSFVNKRAIIKIYSSNVSIFLVDKYGNRYTAKNEYKLNELLKADKYAEKCYEYNKDNDMLLIYLADKIDTYVKSDLEDKSIKKSIISLPKITNKYKNKCLNELIVYTYDNMKYELLDKYLGIIDIEYLDMQEKSYIVECLIIREMWDKAMDVIKMYGYKKLSVNRLEKLAKKGIDSDIKSDILLEICVYVFENGKYNKSIVEYLECYYSKELQIMYKIWEKANEFDIDTTNIEKRILTHMLFANAYLSNAFNVFLSFYEKKCDEVLIGAYLKYNAYRYVVKERILNKKIFDIIRYENEKQKRDLYTIALLKSYSEKKYYTDDEYKYIEQEVDNFLERGIVLPFFKKFSLESMNDRFLVEYIADPKIKVTILYSIDDKEDEYFMEEEMKDVFLGIRVKEFILFYGDNLQYYIVEDNKGDNTITESFNISVSDSEQDDESKYGKINLILMTKAMKDEKTLMDAMKGLAITDYIAENIFLPL